MDFLIYTSEINLSDPVRLEVSAAGSVFIQSTGRELPRSEYRRLLPDDLAGMEEKGLRLPGYADFLRDRGTYFEGRIYVHVSHAIEARKYWLPKHYTIGAGFLAFVTGRPAVRETARQVADQVYASLDGDLSQGILLRFLDKRRTVMYEKFFGPEYAQRFIPDLAGIIQISAQRFEHITGVKSTPRSIGKHRKALLEVLDGAGGNRICIRTADGEKRFFDRKMQPARRSRRAYPSLIAQAKNLLSTVLGVIWHSVKPDKGAPRVLADKQEVERRLSICQACPRFDSSRKKCTLCGCKMPYKVELQAAKCPHPDGDKWRQDD